MASITLRWAGPADADANTDYNINVNSGGPGIGAGVWVDILDGHYDATAPYASPTTGLDTGVDEDETTLVLDSATSFAEGDYVEIDGEIIILGVEAGTAYTGCTRGVGESLPLAHLAGATVTKLHESHVDADRSFPAGRHALRYQIIRYDATGEAVAAKALAVYPPPPPFSTHVTVWGICEMLDGTPHGLVDVVVTYDEADDYGQEGGEHLSKRSITVQSDLDGFWSIPLRKDRYRQGGGHHTITIAPGQAEELQWVVSSLPDVPTINFLET